MTPRLKELYYKEIQPQLKEQLGFKNTYKSYILYIWIIKSQILLSRTTKYYEWWKR